MRRFFLSTLLTTLAFAPLRAEKKLTPEELKQLLEKKDKIFLLDVREPKELEESGVIEGYTNIPLGQLEKRLNEIPKDKVIVTL